MALVYAVGSALWSAARLQDTRGVDHLVVIHSKSGEGAFRGMIPKASGENGISLSVKSLFSMQKLCQELGRKRGRKTTIPCRRAASRTRSCRGNSGVAGTGMHHGREAVVNAPQSSEHWIQSLTAVHVYMYISRKFKRVVVSSFLGLLINHLRAQSRRRDSRSGYPLRSFQQGPEVGREMKVYKWNQPFLSALLDLARSVCPGQQPALLTGLQGAPGKESWAGSTGEEVFGCAASPWSGTRFLPASIFRWEALKLQGKLLWLHLEEGIWNASLWQSWNNFCTLYSKSFTQKMASEWGYWPWKDWQLGRQRPALLTGARKENVSLTSFQLTSIRQDHSHQSSNW